MTELFPNISDELKGIAETGWNIAINLNNPVKAAEFLDNLTNYYRAMMRSEEDIEFLQFYFNMKMEMMKK